MLEPETIPQPEAKAEAKAKVFELKIASFRGDTPATVATPEDFQREGLKLAEVKQVIKNIENERKALVDPLNQTVKRINAMFKGISERFDDAARWIETPMLAFKREELRKQQEAERQAQAERDRLAAEAKKKIDDELAALQEAQRIKDEADRALQAVPSGDVVAAFLAEEAAEQAAIDASNARQTAEQAIRDSRKEIVIETPEFRPTTAAGIRTNTPWKLIIDNPDLVPREYCIPDEKTLGQLARTLKDKFAVPGCRAEQDISFGRR